MKDEEINMDNSHLIHFLKYDVFKNLTELENF